MPTTKRKATSGRPKVASSSADPIAVFARALPAVEATLCKELRAAIDDALPRASSRVWHGAPVWFVGDMPVVGYSVPSKGGVNLLFWNGQAFKDPALTPLGKFKAAQVHYDDAAQLDAKVLRRWLKKAGTELWDHVRR